MTPRCQLFLQRHAALACLLLGALLQPAVADDKPAQRRDCPDIYGRWRVTHVMDKYGNPEPVAINERWDGMLIEAQIGKDKAVLIWLRGKKNVTYARTYKFKQTEHRFNGKSNSSALMIAFIVQVPEENYPMDRCYLELGEYSSLGVENLRLSVLLEKIE